MRESTSYIGHFRSIFVLDLYLLGQMVVYLAPTTARLPRFLNSYLQPRLERDETNGAITYHVESSRAIYLAPMMAILLCFLRLEGKCGVLFQR